MLAIETIVVVRYLTGDHPEQSPRPRALIDSHEVLVSTTVLLETEWVLRSAYGYPSPQVSEPLALRRPKRCQVPPSYSAWG